jgi:hypothetical protein
LPNGRAEKQATRDKETWTSAEVDGQWDPNKVLYLSTESVGIMYGKADSQDHPANQSSDRFSQVYLKIVNDED